MAKKPTKKQIRAAKKAFSGIPFLILLLILFIAACVVLVLELVGVIDLFGEKEREAYEVTGGTVEIHMIDIGQGDSILIMAPEGNILFDAGENKNESEDKLKSYLDGLGIKEIEYFILSHHDADHIGGADMVIDTYSVETVIMEDWDPDYGDKTGVYNSVIESVSKSEGTEIVDYDAGDKLELGELHLEFLGPVKEFNDKNEDSIVVRVDFGKNSILMTGDAEEGAEAELLKTYSVAELDCDVLKVGHHGSSSSTTERFLDAVSPEYALISCGVGNKYGHPHKETVEKLEKGNVKTHRTDKTGNIVLVFDGKDITVKDE